MSGGKIPVIKYEKCSEECVAAGAFKMFTVIRKYHQRITHIFLTGSIVRWE